MFPISASFRIFLDIADILVVAFVVYRILLLIKGTRTFQVLLGMAVIFAAFVLSRELELVTLHTILSAFISSLITVIVVIFQNDIRRALAQMGKHHFWSRSPNTFDPTDVVEEIVRTAGKLSGKQTGALMVVERDTRIRDYMEPGVLIDGVLSSEVLQSIFNVDSPIHDGAVTIASNKIIWAGCVLPLSTRHDLEKNLGTRHRAAMGITEETDAIAVVISEETGGISVAVNGRITRHLELKTLRKVLQRLLYPEESKRLRSKRIKHAREGAQ